MDYARIKDKFERWLRGTMQFIIGCKIKYFVVWLFLSVEKSIEREEMQESLDMQANRASTPDLVI